MNTFWKQALEAAAWTFAQMFIVTFATSFATLGSLEWGAVAPLVASAGLAALGAAVSLLKSTIVRNIGAENSTLISGE